MLNVFIGMVAVTGWLVYFYFYQLWPRQLQPHRRLRIASDRVFSLFYRYIQLSTPFYVGLSMAGDGVPWSATIAWNGLVISAGSILLFVWSMLSLRNQYSHCFDSYVPVSLVEKGPYFLIRHPIYLANCLMFLGMFAATGSWGLLVNCAILLVFYYRAVRQEEAALLQHLPGYREYQQRTGRILPRITRGAAGIPAVETNS